MLKDKRLVVVITAAQLKALRAERKATGTTIGEIVRRAIERYLRKK